MLNISQLLAQELKPVQVKTQRTLSRGATVPIARYRKGALRGMNEILRDLSDRFTYLSELEERKSAILSAARTRQTYR